MTEPLLATIVTSYGRDCCSNSPVQMKNFKDGPDHQIPVSKSCCVLRTRESCMRTNDLNGNKSARLLLLARVFLPLFPVGTAISLLEKSLDPN